ncbi:hypothetical protein LMCDFJHI_01201 [Aeromonas salmonicida]
MDVVGDDKLAGQWFGRPCRHRNVVTAEQSENAQSIVEGLLLCLIASTGGDRQHLEFGTRQRQYEGDGIIVAGITIENNGQRHGQTPYNMTGSHTLTTRDEINSGGCHKTDSAHLIKQLLPNSP